MDAVATLLKPTPANNVQSAGSGQSMCRKVHYQHAKSARALESRQASSNSCTDLGDPFVTYDRSLRFLQGRYDMRNILIDLSVLFLLGGGFWAYCRWEPASARKEREMLNKKH
jgi:hypothetical protein